MLANPGETILGKYRVEEVIGIGGMGRVVRASHLYLQQPVAIKILLPSMAESQSTVARFLREAQATVKLRSEHIARVMDVGTLEDGTPFMVMEYLEGHDLNQILRAHGPQMPQAVVDLMLQACEGISEAHALGIVHRDIKPSNFFITRRPDGSNLLKILDFGISKTPTELSELTGTQTVIGTPTYMAPEQMRTARSTDPRSDIWSMGVVMYQLLCGRPPFEAETYAELVLKVGTEPAAPMHIGLPPGLESIVMRCLEKDPKNRTQNVGELARMLAPYASDPLAAQQGADRASRILASPRGSQPGFPLTGVGGGGMTPPALTPKSWNHNTNGSSVSGSAGQIGTGVQPAKSRRGLVIGGVAALCIAAGAGGFVISSQMKTSAASETHVIAPTTPAIPMETANAAKTPEPPPVETPKTPEPPKPTIEKPTIEPKVEPKVEAKTTETPKVEAKTVETPKVQAKKVEPKVEAKKVEAKRVEAKKVEKKKDTPKSGGTDDLFNDRH